VKKGLVRAMHIIAEYSHKDGRDFILGNHPQELEDIRQVIAQIDAMQFKTKRSREKTMPGRMLYSPIELNAEFKRRFEALGWEKRRVQMKTTIPEIGKSHTGFREIDLVKNKLGLEVQFGKYAFTLYSVLTKMAIFAKRDVINSGVEIVPLLNLAGKTSTIGGASFEEMKANLEYRGESNTDTPTLIVGIDATKRSH